MDTGAMVRRTWSLEMTNTKWTAQELFDAIAAHVTRAKSGDIFVDMHAAKMPLAVLMHQLDYGMRRDMQDTVNGKTADFDDKVKGAEKAKLAIQFLAEMESGEWLVSSRKPGTSAYESVCMAVTFNALPEATRKAMEDDPAKADKLRRIYADNEAALKPKADAEFDRRKTEAERKAREKAEAAALAGKLVINL